MRAAYRFAGDLAAAQKAARRRYREMSDRATTPRTWQTRRAVPNGLLLARGDRGADGLVESLHREAGL